MAAAGGIAAAILTGFFGKEAAAANPDGAKIGWTGGFAIGSSALAAVGALLVSYGGQDEAASQTAIKEVAELVDTALTMEIAVKHKKYEPNESDYELPKKIAYGCYAVTDKHLSARSDNTAALVQGIGKAVTTSIKGDAENSYRALAADKLNDLKESAAPALHRGLDSLVKAVRSGRTPAITAAEKTAILPLLSPELRSAVQKLVPDI